MNSFKHLCNLKRLGLLLMVPTLLVSCDMLQDDANDCQSYLKFRYDYNMLSADAFSNQVDKVEVFFFNESGMYVTSKLDSGEILKNQGYRMELPFDFRGYSAITWAGHHDSYEISDLIPGQSTKDDLLLKMKRNDDLVHNTSLEALWHGQEKEISGGTDVISLVRNTNNLRIILKCVTEEKTPVPADNFVFRIMSDNGYYASNDTLLKDDVISYEPYYQGGDSQEGVIAEINTMRFMEDKNVRLSIYNKANRTYLFGGAKSINLIYYLLKTKMEEYSNMPSQEFLDRQYDWNLTFFYTGDSFIALKVVINDWTFWMNDVDM